MNPANQRATHRVPHVRLTAECLLTMQGSLGRMRRNRMMQINSTCGINSAFEAGRPGQKPLWMGVPGVT
jgi:hypothetical protein